jgi:hypothetical protein
MKTCADCGTTLRNGICTNCHEELYIDTYELPEYCPDLETSKEWRETVDRQAEKQKQIDDDATIETR